MLAAVAVLLAVATKSSRSVGEETVTFVELVGSDTVNLDATKAGDDVVKLPVRTLADAAVGDVKTVQVLLDGRRGAWSSTFAPSFDYPDNDRTRPPVGLSLTVDLTKASRPGTYVVTMEVTGTKQAASAGPGLTAKPPRGSARRSKTHSPPAPLPPQKLELKLVRAEAQLKVDSTVAIERVVMVPGLYVKSDEAVVDVRETTRMSRVANLKATPLGAWRQDRREGTLESDGKPQTVEAGGHGEARFHPAGDFTIGTARGSIEMSADELKAPLVVAYEVRSRLWRAWVVVLIGLGLGVGWLVRVLAVRLIAYDQAVLDVAAFMTEIAPYRSDPDDGTRTAVENLLTPIERALTQRQADAVQQSLVKARTDLKLAQQGRNERLQSASAKVGALEDLIAASETLPPGVATAVASKRDAVANARKDLDARNFSAALAKQGEIRTALWKSLVPHIHDWTTALGVALSQLQSYRNDFPAAADDEANAIIELLQSARGISLQVADTLVGDLQAVVSTRTDYRNRRDHLAKIVERECRETLAALVAVTGLPRGLGALKEALSRIERADLDAPESTALFDVIRDGSVEARNVVRAVCDQVDRWERKKVALTNIEAEIAGRRFSTAAVDVKSALGAVDRLEGFSAGIDTSFLADATEKGNPTVSWPTPVIESRSAGSVVASFIGPDEIQRRSAERWVRWMKRFQYLGAASVILLVGVWTLGDSFIGTPVEILGLFFWGFGTDISVATATDLSPRKKPS